MTKLFFICYNEQNGGKMNEKQMQKPEYHILIKKQNMIEKIIIKLNRKIFNTNNYEKRYKLINQLTEHTNEIIKINSIANYLDLHQNRYNSTPEKIVELSQKLLDDEKVYKRALKIDKRRTHNYEL